MSYQFPQSKSKVPESKEGRHEVLERLNYEMLGEFEESASADRLIADALSIYSHDPSDGEGAGLAIAVLAKALDFSGSEDRADAVLHMIENMYQDHGATELVRDRYGKALNYLIDDYPGKVESSIAKLEELYTRDESNVQTATWLASGLDAGLQKLEGSNSADVDHLRLLHEKAKRVAQHR